MYAPEGNAPIAKTFADSAAALAELKRGVQEELSKWCHGAYLLLLPDGEGVAKNLLNVDFVDYEYYIYTDYLSKSRQGTYEEAKELIEELDASWELLMEKAAE